MNPSDHAAQFGADSQLIDGLYSSGTLGDEELLTIGRLRMRYPDGPHRRRLDQLLLRHSISEDALHAHTRKLWAQRQHGVLDVTSGSGADVDG